MQLRELGRLPVSNAAPAGTDPRQSAEYQRLLEETAKLSSLRGASAVDWNAVTENAATVLQRQAKDIPAAVYLCVGLAHTGGLPGLASGVRVLADLLDAWWDTCFPPLKRLRARVNMLTWWRERIAPLLDAPQEPADPAVRDDLLASLRDLDATLGNVLPDLPPLRDLLERVQRLDVREDAGTPHADHETAPDTATDPDAGETAARPPEATPSEPATAPVTPPATARPQPAPPRTPAVPPASPANPASEEEAQTAFLTAARAYAALAFAGELPAAPAAWAAFYAGLWGGMEHTPPADGDGLTALPPPQEENMSSCRSLLTGGRAAEAAAATARMLPASPFHLDAQHLLFTALTACGRPVEAALVHRECRAFAARLPGVAELRFADGSPFASAATRHWLRAGDAPAPAEGSAAPQDAPEASPETAHEGDALRARARETAAAGHLAAALDMLEDARRTLGPLSARAFPLRMEQARLLALAGHAPAAEPLAGELERRMEEHGLAHWQPDLCLEALRICHAVWSAIETPEARAHAAAIAGEICRLRPSRSPLLA